MGLAEDRIEMETDRLPWLGRRERELLAGLKLKILVWVAFGATFFFVAYPFSAGRLDVATVTGLGAGAVFWWMVVFLAVVLRAGRARPLGVFGRWAARQVICRRARRAARCIRDFSELETVRDGDVVRLRGRVAARDTVDALFGGGRGVVRHVEISAAVDVRARRMHERSKLYLIHDAAVGFYLEDDAGHAVHVDPRGLHLLLGRVRQRKLPIGVERARSTVNRCLSRFGVLGGVRRLTAGERLVRPGDHVEIIGVKDRIADPGALRLERESPYRPALRSGKDRPLLVIG